MARQQIGESSVGRGCTSLLSNMVKIPTVIEANLW